MGAENALKNIEFGIAGMSCKGCSGKVERALQEATGVAKAVVDLQSASASITFDANVTSADRLVSIVTGKGYQVGEQQRVAEPALKKPLSANKTLKIKISGMTCSSCSGRVEKALNRADGIGLANVNLALETAEIHFDPKIISAEAILNLVSDAGYTASRVLADDDSNLTRERTMLIISAILTLPLLGQMVAMFTGLGYHLDPWVQLVLATPVQFFIGWRFYKGAWNALRNKAGNMDLLVALGTSAAYFFSVWRMIVDPQAGHGGLYFEASAMVITLILAGKYMESRAKRSASSALRALMGLRPDSATLLVDGVEIDTPLAQVRLDDIVLLRPGAKVPVDGVIVSGTSELDESLITGEPMPVLRGVGDAVIAGSINSAGVLNIRTDKIGQDTTLAKVAQMVEQAQVGKAPIQRLVDQISAIFVPVIILLALGTFGVWMMIGAGYETALIAAVSVLVIACPCALGLATPTALVAGTGAAARSGILIRDIETLERARRIDTVVFDKTGTLTAGKPEVTEIVAFEGDDAALRALAARVQLGSEHPLGRAIVAAAHGLNIGQPGDSSATIGEGIESGFDGQVYRMGRQEFVTTKATADQKTRALALREGGKTVVWLARSGTVLGLFALADQIRPEAIEAVKALHDKGINVVLMTGDNAVTAAKIAQQAGIDTVIADMRPQDKAAGVARLGAHVAMVGDGVNDAPALAQADLGIALGGGADVAVETAGFVLMRPDPRLVGASLDIAAKTGTKIRQNLFWAFAYNVVCIPIAAMGLLNPAMAGAAMALSSVFVVSNSLLLKRWRANV